MSDAPEDVMLPCGCYLTHTYENGQPTLQIAPCSQDCPNLANALELAQDAGKPVERRVR